VICYDNRDIGQSISYTVGKPGYIFEEMSDDLIKALDSYQIDKAIIMDMSMGEMIVQMIAIHHPLRLLGLVLHASMYFAQGAEELPVYSELKSSLMTMDPMCMLDIVIMLIMSLNNGKLHIKVNAIII